LNWRIAGSSNKIGTTETFSLIKENHMSIVRVGLGETENFAEGYEAIFGKKDKKAEAKTDEKPKATEEKPKEKKAAKK
jgi:hypothetical protein